MPRKPTEFEIGQRFGHLTVTSYSKKMTKDGERTVIITTCDCGRRRNFFPTHLKSGKSTTCTNKRECEFAQSIHRKIKDPIVESLYPPDIYRGYRSGHLEVMSESPMMNYCGKILQHRSVMCRCDCGNEKLIPVVSLTIRHQKTCGFNCRFYKSGSTPTLSPEEAAIHLITRTYVTGAETRNLEFLLSECEFITLIKGNCFYCGCAPSNICRPRSVIYKGYSFKYNGIDRINSDLGYTNDNSVSCCNVCNMAKKSMSIDEFLSWISRVYHHSSAIYPELMQT